MKIRYAQLEHYQPIDNVVIYSLESMAYQVMIDISGKQTLVCDDNDRPYKTPSLGKMRELFSPFQVNRVTLIHKSCYDEMVGLPAEPGWDNTLSIDLHWSNEQSH